MSQRRLLEAPYESDVILDDAAIWVRRGAPPRMPKSHRHDDLELNLVVSGQLDYLFGGRPLQVRAGQIAVFWGATPHRLIEQPDDAQIECCWVHIPLAKVLGWAMPREYLSDLLMSRPTVLPAEAAGRDVESMFHSWMNDLVDLESQEFALLEIHALVRRLLHWHAEHGVTADGLTEGAGHLRGEGMQHVVEMARFVVANFRSDIATADIARATHLNANYATTLFRETIGITLGAYLTRCRVAEAQRLLITTAMTTTEISLAAGFGSQSSFYAHFTRICGQSPSGYRHALR